MNYKINPCKSVMKKVKNVNCDINTMNDLCYGISNAYGDVYGPELKDELDKQCADMISKKKCVLGRNDCNLQRPVKPPIFNRVPHFYPQLLKDGNDHQQSYQKCVSLCDNTKFPNSCRDNCKLDADAVSVENILQNKKHIIRKKSVDGYNKNPSNCIWTIFMYLFVMVIVIVLLVCVIKD